MRRGGAGESDINEIIEADPYGVLLREYCWQPTNGKLNGPLCKGPFTPDAEPLVSTAAAPDTGAQDVPGVDNRVLITIQSDADRVPRAAIVAAPEPFDEIRERKRRRKKIYKAIIAVVGTIALSLLASLLVTMVVNPDVPFREIWEMVSGKLAGALAVFR